MQRRLGQTGRLFAPPPSLSVVQRAVRDALVAGGGVVALTKVLQDGPHNARVSAVVALHGIGHHKVHASVGARAVVAGIRDSTPTPCIPCILCISCTCTWGISRNLVGLVYTIYLGS